MAKRNIGLRIRTLIGVVCVVGFCAVATLPGSVAGAATVKITAVTFSGTAAAPTVTIHGSGFGKAPGASPAGPPYNYLPGCTSQAPLGNKNDGRDFGAQGLWVGWNHVQAGAYVKGAGGYLDCIGLVIKKYTASEIVISLGCQYGYYAKLTNGTSVTVTVAGDRFATKAHFS